MLSDDQLVRRAIQDATQPSGSRSTKVWSDDQLLRRALKDNTPPSSKPDKYRCKKCGKCYAEDRNQEFRFHVMEDNCGKVKDSKTDKLDSMESKQGTSEQ